MPHILTETSAFDATVEAPDDGDAAAVTSVNTGLQALTNRSKYLKDAADAADAAALALDARLDVIEPFVPGTGLKAKTAGNGSDLLVGYRGRTAFTPTIAFASVNNITINTANGWFSRIGDLVLLEMTISITKNAGALGSLTFSGLPYAPAIGSTNHALAVATYLSSAATPGSTYLPRF
jgi:hypothetical protein